MWVAFGCAIAIHLAAVAIAENKSRPVSQEFGPLQPDVIATDDDPAPSQETEIVLPQEQVPPTSEDEAFPQESATPPAIRPRKKTPVTAVVRSIGTGTGRATHAGSVKALTLYAPRPAYPYEARRGGITGSGVAQLTINPEIGNVIEARMAQSTGSAVLDKATVETLRQWRFKPGIRSNVDVPITYTLMGVSY
jgi:TonB family protein